MEAVKTFDSIEESLKREESKRRKREGVVILVTALMVAVFAFFEVQLPDVTPETSLGSNIAFFLLININIILLILLVFFGGQKFGEAYFRATETHHGLAIAGAAGCGLCRVVLGANFVVVCYCRGIRNSIF